jgi:hypothetical protein
VDRGAGVGRVGRARSAGAGAGGLGLLAVLLAACGSAHVVSSDSLRFYVQIPGNWKVYGKSEMLQSAKFAALVANPPQYLMGASADPRPSTSQPFSSSKYPWAILLVTNLGGTTRQSLTLGGLSDVLVNVDQLSQQGVPVQALAQGQLLVKGPLRGTKVAYQVGSGSDAIDYQQATWVNSATDKLWVLMVGCSPTCYQAQKAAIEDVMQSFYVSDNRVG